MVAAVSVSPNPKINNEHTKRTPLLPSEKDNTNGFINNQRKPKSTTTRYNSPSPSTSTSTSNSSSVSSNSSSSRRYPSPLLSRNSTYIKSSVVPPKRSVSVDRHRPAAVRPLTSDLDLKNANVAVVTSSRSLSVSFQGEAFSLPVSKTKVAQPRKGTPERKRNCSTTTFSRNNKSDQIENYSKPTDQHRWPARKRMEKSMIDGNRLSLDLGNLGNSELYDSDSVSSGSISEVQEGRNVPREIVISTRFWQETNSRLRRLHDPGSPLTRSPGSNPIKLKNYTSNVNLISSPIRGNVRSASPSKVTTPPSRGYSPSRIRNAVSTINNNFTETPSVLSFAVDVRRGKVGKNEILDAHMLRLLYNRYLQWRFVNARTEAVLLVQKLNVQKYLWNAWITISDLRDTVTRKRRKLHLLRQKLKLASILREQMTFLEDWASIDKDHSTSLFGAIESLTATTLRLPVGEGAFADVQSLKEAISSAVDVMQAMSSSMCSLLPTVNEVNSLVMEIAKVTAKERALLEQCTYLISLLATMQVKDSSLRTHILQDNRT